MTTTARPSSLALALLWGLVAPLAAQTWTQVADSGGYPNYPNGPNLAAMAYDGARDEVVALDSFNSGSRTWTWNGSAWTQRFPDPNLSGTGRDVRGQMVFDAQRGRVVLFGGRTGAGLLDDTWTWNGSKWTQLSPVGGVHPSARRGGAMVYLGNGRILLHGGLDAGEPNNVGLNDTWILDGETWTQQTGPSTPTYPMVTGGLSFDTVAGRPILLTRNSGGVVRTWTWDGDGLGWRDLNPVHQPTLDHSWPRLCWDSLRLRTMLMGSLSGAAVTWYFDGSDWTQASPSGAPSILGGDGHGDLVYISSSDEMLYHGGAPNYTQTRTWRFVGEPVASGSYAVGDSPRDVALADVDGDGDLDFATADHGDDRVTLRRNDGDGDFSAAVSSLALGVAHDGPVALALGDLDGDGRDDDAALACRDSRNVALVSNLADASPSILSRPTSGRRPSHVAVGRLNGDAQDDIVVVCEGELIAGGSSLEVSLDGDPFSVVGIGGATQLGKVAVVDLDDDGMNDVVALAQGPTPRILLLQGDNTGGLGIPIVIAVASSGTVDGLCADDLDGDGDLDLAVVLSVLFPSPSQALHVFRFAPSGPLDPSDYTALTPIAVSGSFGVDLACGDFEDNSAPGASRRDLAVASLGSGTALTLHDFVGSSFASTDSPAHGSSPIAVAIGDLNADGADDLLIANEGSDDVHVSLSAVAPLTQTYGSGCPGTGGLVPQIGALNDPVLDATDFAVTLAQARSFSPAVLLLSFDDAAIDLGPGSGCTLLVLPPLLAIVRFSNGSGGALEPLYIPNDTNLLGFDAYFQWAVFDPAGAFASTLAMSNGLRIQIGD